MRQIRKLSPASLGHKIERMADHAERQLAKGPPPPTPSPLETAVDALRDALEPTIDGYRHAAIGMTGMFDADRCRSIATVLAQSVVARRGLTTTIARIARHEPTRDATGPFEPDAWQQTLRPQSLNLWPGAHVPENVRVGVDDFELLHWLRAGSEFTLLAFDSLGDVLTRLPLVRRLDGLVIVNSGKPADLDLMASATEMLGRRGVRVLGQVQNRIELGDAGRGSRVGTA